MPPEESGCWITGRVDVYASQSYHHNMDITQCQQEALASTNLCQGHRVTDSVEFYFCQAVK